MNSDLVDWTLYRSFLAILKEGSLTGAAQRLRLTHPTLRRHLEALETGLGAKLFVRSPRGLEPTDLALELASTAETMQLAADAFVRRASAAADEPTGSVRITASEIIGSEILPAMLAEIRNAHPGLEFEVVLTRSVEDLLRREADVAIRMARPVQPDLLARKVGEVTLNLYAHRRWLDRHGPPSGLDDLVAAHHLIGYDRDPAIIQAVERAGGRIDRSAFGYRSDNDLAQLAAVRAGLGVGLGHDVVMQKDPDLVQVLPAFSQTLEVWLATPPALRNVARVAITLEALSRGFRDLARPRSIGD